MHVNINIDEEEGVVYRTWERGSQHSSSIYQTAFDFEVHIKFVEMQIIKARHFT